MSAALSVPPGRRIPLPVLIAAAGNHVALGNHSFRATGIIAYLKNGGTLRRPPARGRRSFMTAAATR